MEGKNVLGFACLNEEKWLALHLPVMLEAVEGVVFVDGGSTDHSVDVVIGLCRERQLPVKYRVEPWQWDFAKQQNHIIELAEIAGAAAMLKWDPDELLFPHHVEQGFRLLKTYKAVKVNRINFEGNRLYYSPYIYPDMQTRFHVLHQGFRWRGRLHASVNAFELWHEHPNHDPQAKREIIWCPHIDIFHYEGIKPIEERSLKWMNYALVKEGKEPLSELPPHFIPPKLPVRHTVEFTGLQPLTPVSARFHRSIFEVGDKAPYD